MPISIDFYQHELVLLAQGAIFWPKHRALILSDVHLGKEIIFQKQGVPVPLGASHSDINRLIELFQHYFVEKLIIVGDLVHAPLHSDCAVKAKFVRMLEDHPIKERILVKGNHDRVDIEPGLFDIVSYYSLDGLDFSHEPVENPQTATIIGHIHPYVRIKLNRASQRYRCFYQLGRQLILPAFGEFTGGQTMSVSQADSLYIIVGMNVMPIKNPAPKEAGMP